MIKRLLLLFAICCSTGCYLIKSDRDLALIFMRAYTDMCQQNYNLSNCVTPYADKAIIAGQDKVDLYRCMYEESRRGLEIANRVRVEVYE